MVNSENNESYSYFFGHLRQLIEDHRDLVFISDRHPSIENGLRKHFSLADYGYYRYHIHCNLKGPLGKKNKDGLKLFDQLSNAYTKGPLIGF
ncbi:UNVERIFIED_CONTAM: transposase [Limosilactobacillus fermentum]